MKKKKRSKFKLWSIPGVALIVAIIIVAYCGYHFISKINAYSALVPTTISNTQTSTNEMVLYQNINKIKYGPYDYIASVRGELIVQLKNLVPLYRIAEIAERYGMKVESKYSINLPSYILRIVDPGEDIGMRIIEPAKAMETMRLVDPGDDIGKYTASDIRNQGFKIDPSVKNNTLVSSGYLENIWRQLELAPDIYSVTLNPAK